MIEMACTVVLGSVPVFTPPRTSTREETTRTHPLSEEGASKSHTTGTTGRILFVDLSSGGTHTCFHDWHSYSILQY